MLQMLLPMLLFGVCVRRTGADGPAGGTGADGSAG